MSYCSHNNELTGPAGHQLALLRGWAAFAPRVEAWERFLAAIGDDSFFHQADWLRAAWAYPGKPMLLGLVERDGEVQAAMGFCPRWETGNLLYAPVRSLHGMAHLPLLYPDRSLLLARADLPADVAAWAARETLAGVAWAALVIGFLNDDTRWFEDALRAVGAPRGWIIRDVACSAEAVIDFTDDLEAYWATRSGKFRREVRRADRRLREDAEVSLRDLRAEGLPWDETWAFVEDVFARTWQRGAGLSPFDEPWREVNLRFLREFYERNRFWPFLLSVDGRPIAFDLYFRDDRTMYQLAKGMDPDYEKRQPGHVLMNWGIERAIEKGYRRIQLGPINDQPHFAYKRSWITEARQDRKLIVVRPWSLYGVFHRTLDACGPLRALWQVAGGNARLRGAFSLLRRLRGRS